MAEIRRALVAGANGIIGKALMQELAAADGWHARALSRRPHGSSGDIAADLTDPHTTRAALAQARDTTHVFYAALAPHPSLAEEDRVNGAMLRNLLDGLDAVGAPLERVVLYQGAKVYGVHLGPVPAPFYEDENPRHIGPNFYFTQEDLLRRRAERGGAAWSILRPDVVVGDAAGNAMNIAMVIGAYAALCRMEGAAFRFPGPTHVYEGVFARSQMPAPLAGQAFGLRQRTPRAARPSTTYTSLSGGGGSGRSSPPRSICRSGHRSPCASPPTWRTRSRPGRSWWLNRA